VTDRLIILLALAVIVALVVWLVRRWSGRRTARVAGTGLSPELQTHISPAGSGIVYFYGPHCPTCRQQAAVLDDLASALDMPVVRLDATQERELTAQLAIMTVPSTVVVERGIVRAVNLGFRSRVALEAQLDRAQR
jgi:thiol-disulfide isomerase/thioredoxin